MMAFSTKKPLVSQPAGKRRTIDDLPEVQRETETLRKLQADLHQVSEKIRRFGEVHHIEAKRTEDAVASAIAAAGGAAPVPAATAEVTQLEERRVVLSKAVERQQLILQQARMSLSTEIYKDHEVEDRAIRRECVETALAVKAAWDRWSQYKAEMHAAGAITSTLYTPFVNCSSASLLPRAIQLMSPADFRRDNMDLLKD